MAEYDRRSSRFGKQERSSGQIERRESRTSGHQGEAIYTGFSGLPLDVQSREDDEFLARILDDDYDEDKYLHPEDERQINQVFQAGIPTAIVGTYGTTLGTKVIWQSFAKVIVQRFGAVAAQALGLSAADGLLPVGEAIAFGLLAVTAWQIYRNWDELWAEAEQILVGQEPGTIDNTGHAPPEVETGTPPIDVGQQVETPSNTGDRTREQPKAEDYVMESRRDVRGHDDAGGHTIERHIGKSDSWLQKRAATLPPQYEASSFADTAIANLTQARVIKENKVEISNFLNNDEQSRLILEIEMSREIGKVVNRSGKVWTTRQARIVIIKEASELGYKILTSFPIRE